jgi:hypothetical protein
LGFAFFEKRLDLEETVPRLDTSRVCSIHIEFGAACGPSFPPAPVTQEFAFWYGTWIKILPRLGGYTYEEEYGTTVTKLVKVKNKEYEKFLGEGDENVRRTMLIPEF